MLKGPKCRNDGKVLDIIHVKSLTSYIQCLDMYKRCNHHLKQLDEIIYKRLLQQKLVLNDLRSGWVCQHQIGVFAVGFSSVLDEKPTKPSQSIDMEYQLIGYVILGQPNRTKLKLIRFGLVAFRFSQSLIANNNQNAKYKHKLAQLRSKNA